VVPEINATELTTEDYVIANPNCSTIQMVLALAPLHKAYGINRVVVSTYQSVSGTGVAAVSQLENEEKGIEGNRAYPHPIYRNALPHCDVFQDNGFTKEEMKLMTEPLKILSDDSLKITATAVRIPTAGGHSESVNIRFTAYFAKLLVLLLKIRPRITNILCRTKHTVKMKFLWGVLDEILLKPIVLICGL
jgi:aspartate-semialdehyde dehydrogenase